MKKNKSSNNPQILSPANYIRQKSRNLPISKCFVNKDWDETQLCQVIIVREHTSGNVTACLYLVDLGCLGIKDTHFLFNVPWEEINELLDEQKKNGLYFTEVPYELAHNIIYAALEYAEDWGFEPHKDFTSVTSYFLEEDKDDIPVVPVECGGDDGNPLYVNTGFDSPARVKQILAQLDKTAGEGNYHYILDAGSMEEDNDDDDDDEIEDIETLNEIEQMSSEERKKQFIELILKGKEGNVEHTDEEVVRMVFLSEAIAFDLSSRQAIDKQLKRFKSIFKHEIVDEEELPNSLFTGVQNMAGETIADLFDEALDMAHEIKNPKKIIAQIRKEAGNVPVTDFLELYYLKQKNSKKYKQQLEASAQKFPDYFLILIYKHLSMSGGDWEADTKKLGQLLSTEKLPVTKYETIFFFSTYLVFISQIEPFDINVFLAFEEYIMKSLGHEDIADEMFASINTIKMSCLVNHFIQTGELLV